jgi:DNA-binding NtrC family response regulator
LRNAARIHLVDHNKNIRNTFAAILEDEGQIVDLATDGKQTIRETELSFTMWRYWTWLPDMKGVEVLTKMRDTVPKMRKIMVTGFTTLKAQSIRLRCFLDI